jgi:serine/threonine-protein kinase RsbW
VRGATGPMRPIAGGADDAGQRPGQAEFAREYPALPESVGAARASLVEFATRVGAPADVISAVELAVSEAATNVVVHAYRDAEQPGVMEVTAVLAGSELCVIVADAGSGLRPRSDSPGLGLGLGIIAQVSDSVDIVHRSSGGIELRIRFAVARGGTESATPR